MPRRPKKIAGVLHKKDKTYGYSSQQTRRNGQTEDRKDEESFDDRLADGFDLMSDDDPKDPPPNEVTGYEETP